MSKLGQVGMRPLTQLGGMPVETFLRDYWQKEPLVIRNAFPEVPLVPAEELAGYSLEDEVESRILIETPGTQPLQSQWEQHHGPFNESFYEQLPASHWTLLVQAVDHLHPKIHHLLHQFRFIPNWRIDDVMVSYAADGGNVGPHFDYYDVFLLQAQGSRHWQLGQRCTSNSELRTDTECKILTQFEPTEDWLLHPGDMLYIPPNIAHWGVAQGECITYSVGFRAPSYSDILLDLCQDIASDLSPDHRFSDTGRTPNDKAGEITEEDIIRVRSIVHSIISDDTVLRDWFGRYMTQPCRQSPQLEADSAAHPVLSPQARAAYAAVGERDAVLYINGQQFPCSLPFAEQLCNFLPIATTALDKAHQELVQVLLDHDWMQ